MTHSRDENKYYPLVFMRQRKLQIGGDYLSIRKKEKQYKKCNQFSSPGKTWLMNKITGVKNDLQYLKQKSVTEYVTLVSDSCLSQHKCSIPVRPSLNY